MLGENKALTLPSKKEALAVKSFVLKTKKKNSYTSSHISKPHFVIDQRYVT